MSVTENKSSPAQRGLAAIILAAGRSTRMKSDRPKVMHELCGRPLLAYVLDACRQAGIDRLVVVVGFGREEVEQAFAREPAISFVEQREQKGTGHAVLMCRDSLAEFRGDCVVIAGDMPLVRAETLRNLVGAHRAAGAAASLATTVLDDPAGYGRIVREPDGAFARIVEHRDCTPQQLTIREVNPSYYCFDAAALFDAAGKIKPDNAKGEYYITDTLELIRAAGGSVLAPVQLPAEEATGVNSRQDLAVVGRMMQRRICARWMAEGVTIVDPQTTWIDSPARIGEETVVRPFSFLEGNCRIGAHCRIGPYAYVTAGAVIEDGAVVGPGVMSALDTATPRHRPQPTGKRTVQVQRRPPAQSGIA